jgi:adenylyltransferase/sulfurtransferase
MISIDPNTIASQEGRFARLEAIEWWNQSLLRQSNVLVIGAGALGNEVIKNLALLGIGNVVIADLDRIELSNLSRSVLFRAEDEGRFKAECAAETARSIFPEMRVLPRVGNIMADLGFGYFRWANIVVGALDNREARVFVNAACARLGRPWIDGGIEVLTGIVRGFSPPTTACYECTMSKVDWDLLNKRRSCSLLARRALAQRGTPTTPTTASIIGAMQVQELVKPLHGLSTLMGRGFVFDGAEHSSYSTRYQISPECGWHETAAPVHLTALTWNSPLTEVWQEAEKHLGNVDAIDFGRELFESLTCPRCQRFEEVFQPVERITEEMVRCHCGSERTPHFVHSIAAGSSCLKKTVREIGLPQWEVVWARRGTEIVGIEMSGDNPFGVSPMKGE